MTLPSAKFWSFPPRPQTHHVQAILPDLAHPVCDVAIEAGALVYSDDAGRTWCDRVSGSPRDTHCLAVHPLDPIRLHSAAGDGYFESVDGGDSWRRVVDGLEDQYCWSIAISLRISKTLLLSTSKSAYGAHYKESANSSIYRRTGSDTWKPVRKGLPDPQGWRILWWLRVRPSPEFSIVQPRERSIDQRTTAPQWHKLAVQWNSKATAEHAIGMAIVEEGYCCEYHIRDKKPYRYGAPARASNTLSLVHPGLMAFTVIPRAPSNTAAYERAEPTFTCSSAYRLEWLAGGENDEGLPGSSIYRACASSGHAAVSPSLMAR